MTLPQTQVINGKAFEYAVVDELNNLLQRTSDVYVVKDHSYTVAQGKFNLIDNLKKKEMRLAANAASKQIKLYEPLLESGKGTLNIYMQADREGQLGDVRDIVLARENLDWEVGISCKYNHDAVKHARLSRSIDFGQLWFGLNCSNSYFREITPIFDELESLRRESILWRNIEEKENRFYIPILEAFLREVESLKKDNEQLVAQKFVGHLLGEKDFYKVMSENNQNFVKIQGFNIKGTLNQSTIGNHAVHKIKQLILPSRIIDFRFRENSQTTIDLTLSDGWAISFRIHNASSVVEPSLKFDIRLVGTPASLGTIIQEF
jgi:hypothetical protein